jgi:hypothetical protein
MWKLNADVLYSTSVMLERLKAASSHLIEESRARPEGIVPTDAQKNMHGKLKFLREELGILNATMTMASVERLMNSLSENRCTHKGLMDAIIDIDLRLRDELSQVNVYVLDETKIKYLIKARTFFDDTVTDRVPLAIPDIEDAGKCLALGQGTASVFHSMRIVEAGLKALAKLLEIDHAPSWEAYIKRIADKMGEKHAGKSNAWKAVEPTYRDVIGDLQAIKIAWRNPTMHIVRRYSVDEAEEIFRSVRTFMTRLTPIVS